MCNGTLPGVPRLCRGVLAAMRAHIAWMLLAVASGCGQSDHLDLTYRSTSVMFGTTDTMTLSDAAVERKSVQQDCTLTLSGDDLDGLLNAIRAVDPASAPADASPGAMCTNCQRFELTAKLSRVAAADISFTSHWLVKPAGGSDFLTFVGKVDDVWMRVPTQGSCASPSF